MALSVLAHTGKYTWT